MNKLTLWTLASRLTTSSPIMSNLIMLSPTKRNLATEFPTQHTKKPFCNMCKKCNHATHDCQHLGKLFCNKCNRISHMIDDCWFKSAPFRSCREMHTFIDSSMLGNSPWQCLVSSPDGVDEHPPGWKRMSYEVWYRNPNAVVSAMLDNPDFDGQFDLHPHIDLSADGRCRWNNVMSS